MRKKYYIGIDIGATNTKYALLDKNARIKIKKVIATTAYKNEYEFVSISRDIICGILRELKLKRDEVFGTGIGAPGAIDSVKGIVHYFVNIRRWKEVPLKKIMESKIKIPTYVDNDVNVMTMGEFYYGAGKGARNMIGLTLGSGVGGGLILEGRIYRGTALAGGEIGHMPINVIGPKCLCGGSGCMEVYVGNKYIVKRYKESTRAQGHKTQVKNLELTPKVIYERARSGDRMAVKVLRDTGIYLGICLSGVINLLNPEIVVIGGGVANAGRFIFDSVKETIKKRAMPLPAKTVRITKAKLGEDAGVIGAVALVKEKQARR